MDERWTIEKLDGETNWNTWKFQMKHLLLTKDRWGFVDGTDPIPAEAATAEVKADYRKRSQKSFSVIVLAITSSQLYLVTSCLQPREAWEALRDQFERDTLANKLLLKKLYFRLEMKEDTSIEQHLKHMKELADRLAAMGAPITEEDQVVTLLGSLPKSYSTFVTAQEARENVSLSYLQQALVHEEQKRHGQEHFKNADMHRRDAALVGESRKNFKPRKPICFGCQQPGHFQCDCHKVKKVLSHKAETADERAEDLEVTGAFAASTNCSQAETWLVDLGASSHMT